MLTIQGRDVAKSVTMKYTVIIGAAFFLLTYLFPKYFNLLLATYVILFVAMMVSVIGRRRVKILKIQGKRLDIYFAGWRSEAKSFQLNELQGGFTQSSTVLGKQHYKLELSQNGELVAAVKTQDGFEEKRLRTLYSLLSPA